MELYDGLGHFSITWVGRVPLRLLLPAAKLVTSVINLGLASGSGLGTKSSVVISVSARARAR